MKNSVNVYWSTLEGDESKTPLRLLSLPPENVALDFVKRNKNHLYTKCPAFFKEFKNTFFYKSFYNFIIDIDPENIEPTGKTTSLIQLNLREINSKHFNLCPHIIFFSDESLEMSLIPSSLHMNNFTNNTNVFPGRYDIGKWFRPLFLDFFLRTPYIEVKRGDALFYLKFHTNKKINFINFKYTKEIQEIEDACIHLKFIQPGYNFKSMYNLFIKSKTQKRLLKEIKSNIIK